MSELLVLGLLARNEMYGYQLARSLQAVTRREIQFGEGLLYPLLHALEQRRLLRSRKVTVSGRPRIYYRATGSGRRHLSRLKAKWRRTNTAVAAALGEKSYA